VSAITLEVMNRSGHLTLSWDSDNDQEVAAIREEVARLKEAGYSFFLADDTPADEVAAGKGSLSVRRIEDPTQLPEEPETSETPAPKRRGRPARTVAMAPMRGG